MDYEEILDRIKVYAVVFAICIILTTLFFVLLYHLYPPGDNVKVPSDILTHDCSMVAINTNCNLVRIGYIKLEDLQAIKDKRHTTITLLCSDGLGLYEYQADEVTIIREFAEYMRMK